MKRIFILFSLFIFNFSLFAQWQVINEGPAVSDMFFTSAQTGWMTGVRMLMKTIDGGENWYPLQLDDDLNFYNTRFFNDTLGLAAAGAQRDEPYRPRGYYNIFRTVDGGLSWQEIASAPGKNKEVLFVTDSIFFNAHDNRLFRTKDAGQSWTPVLYSDLPVFINKTTGFARVNDKLWRSIDSGESWLEMPDAPNDFDMHQMQFVNDSTGYMFSYDVGQEYKYLYVTADTGRSWATRYSMTPRERIYKVGIMSEDTLYAVFDTEDSSYSNDNVLLKCSTDGGRSWSEIQQLAYQWSYNSFIFDSRGKGYLLVNFPWEGLSNYGAIILRQNSEGKWPMLFSSYLYNALCFVNEEKGFAAGGIKDSHVWYGDIFITKDGGRNWELSYTAGVPIKDLVFTDELNGFALTGGFGTSLLKTDNGGDSWYLLAEEFSGKNLANGTFYFKDKKQGWLAGTYNGNPGGSIILKTTDGGETWYTQWKYPDADDIDTRIYDLQVVNSVVWAVGEKGLMLKSIDSSSSKVLEPQTDLPLNKIHFTDKDYGWIAGGYYDWQTNEPHSVLLRTKDGGQNWQGYNSSEFLINDLLFEDSLQGWAAGRDSSGKGIILETVDGGESWLTRVAGLRGELRDFYYRDGTLWATGHYGLVLKKEGVIWTDINSGIKYPSGMQLFQNYPNPFNPKTIINYIVGTRHAVSLHINLSIFNLLGQKIATLVDKKQPAGRYNVEWDAKGFASGVYVYTIEASNGFKQSRKLLLLK